MRYPPCLGRYPLHYGQQCAGHHSPIGDGTKHFDGNKFLYSNYSLSEESETGRGAPLPMWCCSSLASSLFHTSADRLDLLELRCRASQDNSRQHYSPHGMRSFPVGVYPAAACASWLTTDSAILVSAWSVASSSSSVSSSSETASSSPNSAAHVRSVPYREIS